MKFFKSAIATAALTVGVLAAAPANALTQGTIPAGVATNDFLALHGLGPVSGYFGGNLSLVGGVANILVEYFGAEAGNTNTFAYSGCNAVHGGGNTFINPAPAGIGANDALTSCTVVAQAPALLPFSFTTTPPPTGVVNGANPDGSTNQTLVNFFISFDNPAYTLDTNNADAHPLFGQSVFLFLDDNGGGPGTDDNHDDMVIRLSITCTTGVNCGFRVPEPGSLALAGLALLALGASGRKTLKK